MSVESNLGFKNYESVFEFKIERDYKHRKGVWLTAFDRRFCNKHFFFIPSESGQNDINSSKEAKPDQAHLISTLELGQYVFLFYDY